MSVFLGECFVVGRYFVVTTSGRRGGRWWACAEFEQDTEYGEQSLHGPVYRHRVPGTFSTKAASFEAACEYAQRTLAEGTVAVH